MVGGIRPAAGAAVELKDFSGAQSVRDWYSAFLVRIRFESVDGVRFDIFSIVFPVNRRKPKAHILLFSAEAVIGDRPSG